MNDHPMNDDASDGPMDGQTNDGHVSDGPADERIALLSSYLDDRVTDDERARVEGDHRAMAEVARLRRVRASTARVEPPDADVREHALAAALATADVNGGEVDSHAGRTAAAGPTVVPLLRRRILAAAAACAAVAALGVVAVTVQNGSDDDSATIGDAAVERSSDTAPGDESGGADHQPSSADAGDGAELPATGPTAAATPEAPIDEGDDEARREADGSAEPLPDDAFANDVTGDDTGDDTGDSDAGAESVDDAAGIAHVGAVDEATLAAVVRSLLDEPSEGLAATPCTDVVTPVLGTGDYLGVPVLLGPDPGGRLARAVDAEDCSVVAEVPLAHGG